MTDLERSAGVYFYIRYKDEQFAYRRMFMVPRIGDLCVFNEARYQVEVVEWCLDLDAIEAGVRVNVELAPRDTEED